MSLLKLRTKFYPALTRFLSAESKVNKTQDIGALVGMKVMMCTPYKTYFNGYANQINAKTTAGSVGILPNYVPSILLLDRGLLTIISSELTLDLVVAVGFLTVHQDSSVYIYVSEAVTPDLIKTNLIENATEHFTRMQSEDKQEGDKNYAVAALSAINDYVQFSSK